MDMPLHLYLFTLEVAPLEIGNTYNPLPSHLTLISRFYSNESSDSIADKVSGLFNETSSIELTFGPIATIGPKHTIVHIAQQIAVLRELHNKLSYILDSIGVNYTQPEYIGEGWKPHISKRDNYDFAPGHTQLSKATYLIEVRREGENYSRTIQKRFNLSG